MNSKMVVLTGAAMMMVCSSFAEECTVSSAPDLYAKLLSYYEAKSANNTIYLEPGDYDVSDYDMGYYKGGIKYDADGLSHLSIYRTRLVGKGTDARKVVIYGNRTKRILVNSAGELCNLTISNGCVAADGGGVWAFHSSVANANASNVVVTCCEAVGKNGGGVNGGAWDGCEFIGNEAKNGGGSYEATLKNCTVADNQANAGGGVWGGTVDGTHICGNQAEQYGGGVYMNNSSCQLTDSVVSNNCVDGTGMGIHTYGGGVYSSVSKALVIKTDVVFNCGKNDASKNNYGGGVYGGTYTDCLIAGNALCPGASSIQGGGAHGATLIKCVVRDNYAAGMGGAMNAGSAESCIISNNATASYDGFTIRQAAYLKDCDINGTITSSVLDGCRVCDYTNACYIAEGANVAVSGWFRGHHFLVAGASCATNCLFARNDLTRHTGSASGYLFYASAASANWRLVNCTVADNNSSYTLSIDTSKMTGVLELKNSIFVRNWNGTYAGSLTYASGMSQSIDLINNVIGRGRSGGTFHMEAGTVVITEAESNKLFVEDGSRDSYALARKFGSGQPNKARNIGLVENWMASAFDIRGAGYPRLRDGKVDAGCYQCWIADPGLLLMVR